MYEFFERKPGWRFTARLQYGIAWVPPWGGPPLANPWYFATKIESYLPEVNFERISLEKVREDVLIFNSRKYGVVVVG